MIWNRCKSVMAGVAMAAIGLASPSAVAEVDVVAIDFGQSPGPSCGESPLFAGTFDGSSDFVAMTLSDCGVIESPSLDLGDGVVFQFTNVSGWNNTDGVGPDQVQALTGDHFFTAGPQGADDPAAFSLTGLATTDIVILEFIDRRGGEAALVTFEGVTTLVSSDAEGEFTDVSSGGVTGQTVYAGSFTGPGGSGEGNLAGARITIIRNDGGSGPCPADFNLDGVVNGADFGALLSAWGKCGKCPEDLDGDGVVGGSDIGALLAAWGDCPGGGGPTGACCLGEACWSIGEADCATLGGQYAGDDTSCDDVTCEPPAKGSCCEAGVVPGCIDAQCSSAVCLVSPDCCSVLWDADCATLAIDICNDCDGTTDFSRYAIDFGQATGCTSPLFTGTFDGSSDFIAMTLSDCGVVESPTLDLGGGVTFGFVNVSGWNNTDGFPANEVPALTGDHFFSSALGADDPVAFSVDGLDPGDLLILEFLDRRGSETALVTFEGVQTLVDLEAEGRFTDVSGGGVTGKSSYSGSFTGADGVGEGNLSGARITIIRSGGETEGACCLGGSCSTLDAVICQAIGGEYQGDGTDCGSVDCEPVGFGPCCEPGEIPGCVDLTCSYVVCLTMPDCCDVLWDADCAAMAITECNDCDGTTDTKVSAIDFGQSPGAAEGCNGPSPLYSGAFDGIDGFVAMDMSDCGVVESPSIDLGSGLTLSFTNVSGWNNTDGVGPESTQALTGDHFFSSALEADDPVQFSITGANPCTTIILEFADRRGNEVALVTFEGTTTLVDAVPDTGGAFTDVSGGGVTGKSSYTGSFTGRDGVGEGNLAGARITVIPGDPDCDSGLCDGGIGDCGDPQSGPGCGCDECEDLVCAIDPICCTVAWDEFCAGLAESQCGP